MSKERIDEMKKFIQLAEGTWALPQSEDQYRKFAEILFGSGPRMNAVQMKDALYNIYGDDQLFDMLDELEDADPNSDARPYVIDYLKKNDTAVYKNLYSMGKAQTFEAIHKGRKSGKKSIDLSGPDGNAFVLLGYAVSIGRQLGWDNERMSAVKAEMQSGDYENLLMVFDREFGDYVDLYRGQDDDDDDELEEGKWDYPDSAKGRGKPDSYLSNAAKLAREKRSARKEWRKAQKAKRHQALMRGEPIEDDLEEARSDSIGRKFNKAMYWSDISSPGGPKGTMDRIKKDSDKELIDLLPGEGDSDGGDGSPRRLQVRAIKRELKRRHNLTPRGNIREEHDEDIEEGIGNKVAGWFFKKGAETLIKAIDKYGNTGPMIVASQVMQKPKKTQQNMVQGAKHYLENVNDHPGLRKFVEIMSQEADDELEEAHSDTIGRRFNKATTWNPGALRPNDILASVREYSDRQLGQMMRHAGDKEPGDGTPRRFQMQAIQRELRRRHNLTPRGNIREDADEDIEEGFEKGSWRKKANRFNWFFNESNPNEIRDYVRSVDDSTLILLAKRANEQPDSGSPRALQIRLIDQELKRRHNLTPRGNIREDADEDETEMFYLIIIDGDNRCVARIEKQGGYWHEECVFGDAPDNFSSKRYMSYLSPEDVISWLNRDYNTVLGPYADEYEAEMEMDRMGESDDEYGEVRMYEGVSLSHIVNDILVEGYGEDQIRKYKDHLRKTDPLGGFDDDWDIDEPKGPRYEEPKTNLCPTCQGMGCDECQGEGEIFEGGDDDESLPGDCPGCEGWGFLEGDREEEGGECDWCEGSGYHMDSRRPGTEDEGDDDRIVDVGDDEDFEDYSLPYNWNDDNSLDDEYKKGLRFD